MTKKTPGRKPYMLEMGQKFGLLTVIEEAGSRSGHRQYLCECDCGEKRVCRGSHLRKGQQKSCGCGRSTALKSYWGKFTPEEKKAVLERSIRRYRTLDSNQEPSLSKSDDLPLV